MEVNVIYNAYKDGIMSVDEVDEYIKNIFESRKISKALELCSFFEEEKIIMVRYLSILKYKKSITELDEIKAKEIKDKYSSNKLIVQKYILFLINIGKIEEAKEVCRNNFDNNIINALYNKCLIMENDRLTAFILCECNKTSEIIKFQHIMLLFEQGEVMKALDLLDTFSITKEEIKENDLTINTFKTNNNYTNLIVELIRTAIGKRRFRSALKVCKMFDKSFAIAGQHAYLLTIMTRGIDLNNKLKELYQSFPNNKHIIANYIKSLRKYDKDELMKILEANKNHPLIAISYINILIKNCKESRENQEKIEELYQLHSTNKDMVRRYTKYLNIMSDEGDKNKLTVEKEIYQDLEYYFDEEKETNQLATITDILESHLIDYKEYLNLIIGYSDLIILIFIMSFKEKNNFNQKEMKQQLNKAKDESDEKIKKIIKKLLERINQNKKLYDISFYTNIILEIIKLEKEKEQVLN